MCWMLNNIPPVGEDGHPPWQFTWQSRDTSHGPVAEIYAEGKLVTLADISDVERLMRDMCKLLQIAVEEGYEQGYAKGLEAGSDHIKEARRDGRGDCDE